MSRSVDLVRKMACETAKCEMSEPVATGVCGGEAEQPQIATDSLNSQFATSQKLLVFIVDVEISKGGTCWWCHDHPPTRVESSRSRASG
jgi:hypothetical protein